MDNVSDFFVSDDRYDAGPHVVAHARALAAAGQPVMVVTEEVRPRTARRRSLSAVCDELTIAWTDVPGMFAKCGQPWP